MEASVVLSGIFIQRHTFSRSFSLVLEYMWLKESCFHQVPWTSCRNRWWHLWDLRTLWWCRLLWRFPSLFDLSLCWWVPARATWTTVKAAVPWVLWWPTGWASWSYNVFNLLFVWCRRIDMLCVSALTGVLSGGLLGPDGQRSDKRHRWLHGLQHCDPTHPHPRSGNA